MIDVLYGLIAIIVFLIAALLFRTAWYTRGPMEVPPLEEIDVDGDVVAAHLSRAVQFETVSQVDDLIESGSYQTVQAFINLQRTLKEFYPSVFKTLQYETVSDFSLLLTWPGSDDTLKPMLIMAHQDVVPVEESTRDTWEHAPFTGQIADGFVWGRGTLDFKNGLIGSLEAVDWLVRSGFQPRRTLYLAFGHDEEVGGIKGAQKVVDLLESRGVRLESVLDEGGLVIEGMIPGVTRPVGMVGIAEKGYLSIELKVSVEGGHSSTPAKETAIGILAAAIERIQNKPSRATLKHAMRTLMPIAGDLPLVTRTAVANAWLFRPLLIKQLSAAPKLNALLRTTTAPTIVQAGVKDNVLPTVAHAVVNCRILPGETIGTTIKHLRRVIHDPRVEVLPIRLDVKFSGKDTPPADVNDNPTGEEETDTPQAPINGWNPSEVTPVDGAMYGLMEYTVRQVFPEALVAPFLMMAASDSRHYTKLCENVFRFAPVLVTNADLGGIHSVNEHLSVDNCRRMVQFYIQWIRNNNEES